MGELEAEEPSGGTLDVVGDNSGAFGIWESSGRHLGNIREASGRHLGGICGRHLGGASGIRDAFGKHLGSIREASGKHLRGICGWHLGSGSFWEPSGKHLGSIWDSRRPWGFRRLLEAIIAIPLS